MWTYNYNNSPELYHHGVKGMKWGVRKARKATIKVLEAKKRRDKTKYNMDRIRDMVDQKGDPRDKTKARLEKRNSYKYNDAKNSYKIARQKAKLDPDYKNSQEYKQALSSYGKERAYFALRELMKPPKRT